MITTTNNINIHRFNLSADRKVTNVNLGNKHWKNIKCIDTLRDKLRMLKMR